MPLFKKKAIIIVIISLFIILGIIWYLIQPPNIIEGLDAPALSQDIFAGVNAKLTSNNLPNIEPATLETAFNKISRLIRNEAADIANYVDPDLNKVSAIDTTAIGPYDDHSFFYGKKFSDGMCKSFIGSDLNNKCNELTAENCNSTDCCIMLEGKKCVAGNETGPTTTQTADGQDIDYTYYSYKNTCYGACGVGQTSANPCSSFSATDKNISRACIARLWAQTGCTNIQYITDAEVTALAKYNKQEIQQEFSANKAEVNYAKCYGADENKWPAPCIKTTPTSTNLSARCLKKLFISAGCSNLDTITDEYATANSTLSKSELVNTFTKWSNSDDSDTLTKCYGIDETKWPAPCHETTDDSTDLSKRCIRSIYKSNTNCPSTTWVDEMYDKPENNFKGKLKSKWVEETNWYSHLINLLKGSNRTIYKLCNGTYPPSAEYILGVDMNGSLIVKPTADLNAAWGDPYNQGINNVKFISSPIQLTDKSFVGAAVDTLLYTKPSFDDTGNWVKVDGTGYVWSVLKLSGNGGFIGVGTNGLLYTRPAIPNAQWTQKSNQGWVSSITLLKDGTIAGVGSDNQIYTFSLTNSAWAGPVGNSCCVLSIAQSSNGTIYGIGMDNNLYKKQNLTDAWVIIPNSGKVKSISIINI